MVREVWCRKMMNGHIVIVSPTHHLSSIWELFYEYTGILCVSHTRHPILQSTRPLSFMSISSLEYLLNISPRVRL